MAAAAAALPYLQAIGTVMSVVGALNSSRSEASASNYNAQVSEQNAATARAQGTADATQQARNNYLRISGIRAGYGASGVSSAEGSPLDILASSVEQAKLDEQNILYNAELRATGYDNNATLDRSRASSSSSGGLYKAASAGLVGGTKAYDMFRGTGSTIKTDTGFGSGSGYGNQDLGVNF